MFYHMTPSKMPLCYLVISCMTKHLYKSNTQMFLELTQICIPSPRGMLDTGLRMSECMVPVAPNDDFLLNTLKTLFRLYRVLSLRSLEMHSKRYYKICICLVILGELERFGNYKGFRIIFQKTLHTIKGFTKVRIFLTPLSITVLNPKILVFPFH